MSTKQNKYSKNHFFMNLAFMQAEKVLGKTNRNPAVGCCVVKNNNLISLASTSYRGRPHAEANALKFSQSRLKNSTLYVTLEPCHHYGKTSPCVNKIINKKIKKVFIAEKDPDPRTFNKTVEKLKKNNIRVDQSVCSIESKKFYKSYFLSKKEKLPFVTAKLAVSKDFYTINKKKRWITNEFSRARSHLLRSKHDCIITSSKTIKKDDSNLTCRISGLEKYSPARVILDKNLLISHKSNIIKTANRYKTILFYNKINLKKLNILKKFKIKTIKISLNNSGKIILKDVLFILKKMGFSRILLESGTNLVNSFLKDRLINDFYLFISNNKLNKNGRNSFKKSIKFFFKNKKSITEKVNLLGDKLSIYRLK